MYGWAGCSLNRDTWVEDEKGLVCPSASCRSVDEGELLSNRHKGALQASGDAEEVRKTMTLAHSLRGGAGAGSGSEDWRQILPYAPVRLRFP